MAARPAAALRTEAVVDAGDYVEMPDGRKIHLLRATESTAVAFQTVAKSNAGLAALKVRAGLPAFDETAQATFRNGRSFHFLRGRTKGTTVDPKVVQNEPAVAYARHVLVEPKSHTRMVPTDVILAAFPAKTTTAQVAAIAQGAGLQVVSRGGNASLNVWRLRLAQPKNSDPLVIAQTLGKAAGVLWAQPDFLREIRHSYTPPNALFGDQQALLNSGLNRAVAGADVSATSAWDYTTGIPSVVIAIIDDGVDINHPGLRIFTNPGESGNGRETNGIDDDGNGYIDDVHGWDFANNDNDPSPVGTNGHGTGTAGVAAGIFSTAAKTAGIAGGCTILPVKIVDDSGNFTTDDIIGTAILYATSFADVLSNSWGGGSETPYIDSAIDYAVTEGRGGKGCPVFFATGNYASSWMSGGSRVRLSTAGLSGSYFFGFYYGRNDTADGEETIRIDNVCVLDADGYTHRDDLLYDEDFEAFYAFNNWEYLYLNSGFWQGLASDGLTFWTLDTNNAFQGTGGIYSAASPQMTSGQYSVLVTPPITVTGVETIAFSQSLSISADSDFFVLLFDGNTGAFTGLAYGPWQGPPPDVAPDTLYPASYYNTIAVGAADDQDLRSDYSGYAGHLDFLASSNGGWNDIATLDPLGDVGWTPDDYKMNFGGTSAAAPLAAGTAALMLSVNPGLTASQIRTMMQSTCDQVGGVSYTGGTNLQYGYGRVNASRAVASAMPVLNINDVIANEGSAAAPGTATFTISLSAPTTRDVTVQFGTADATALAGTNYNAASGSLTIPAGGTSSTTGVSLIGGVLQQPSAYFTMNLSLAANALLTAKTSGKGTITALDSDGDGIPDYWETAHGLNPFDPTDAPLDPNHDGLTNLEAYLFGTNPSDPTDSHLILNPQNSGNDFVFTLRTAPGLNYRIEYTGNLTDPNSWQPLGSDFTATGSTTLIRDTGVLGTQAIRYYRARALSTQP